MSLEDFKTARELLKELGGDFEGPKPEKLVVKAEETLGLEFPPSYRDFLRKLGCGDIHGIEIYGVVDDDFEDSSVPDGIWLTLSERDEIGLDHSLVLIGVEDEGNYLALDTNVATDDGENPVVRLDPEGKRAEILSPSFGTYFLEVVQSDE